MKIYPNMPTRRLNSESNDSSNQHNVSTESLSDEEPNRSGQGNSRRRHRSRSLLIRRLPFRYRVQPGLNRLEFIAEAVENQLTEDFQKLQVSAKDEEGQNKSLSNVDRTINLNNPTAEEIRAVSSDQAEPMDIDSCSSMSIDEPIIPERKRQLETTKTFVEREVLHLSSKRRHGEINKDMEMSSKSRSRPHSQHIVDIETESDSDQEDERKQLGSRTKLDSEASTNEEIEHKILQVGRILARVERDVARARNFLRIPRRQSQELSNYGRRMNFARMGKRRWPGKAEE
ncbi:hypothetical protein ACOME3_008132 [Neoechinorhynchus agilis]